PSTKNRYYRFDYEVEILFGLTELKAYDTWKEHGIEKRCVFSVNFSLVHSNGRSGVKRSSFMTTKL
ncbi:hypothetical protein M378DRAFT_167983, partial [Amanita muscaria Koide BX008]